MGGAEEVRETNLTEKDYREYWQIPASHKLTEVEDLRMHIWFDDHKIPKLRNENAHLRELLKEWIEWASPLQYPPPGEGLLERTREALK